MSTQIKKNGNWVTVAGGTRMWVGTKAALQAALDAGELVDGTAVMVTDDYDDYEEGEPIGVIQAYMGTTAPQNWLLCDGSAFDTSLYPKLYELLGKNTVPDLREVTLKGIGQNTQGAAHQTIALGAFQDDQFQGHKHNTMYIVKKGETSYGSGGNALINTNYNNQAAGMEPTNDGTNGDPRTGSTTEVKAVGVNFIIRAA